MESTHERQQFAAAQPQLLSLGDDHERHIPFEGCFNFRDLGGYATRDGRTVRWRRLFRADAPHALTDTDRVRWNELAIVTIIDLRTRAEGDERGHYPGDRRHHLPMFDVLPSDARPAAGTEAFVAEYRRMFDGATSTIARAVTLLADTRAHPAMFHCTAGKDRAGILAATVLALLGVPDETIAADYALSTAPMMRLVEWSCARSVDARARFERLGPTALAADPDTMTRFLAGIRADYGTIDAWAEHAGVGAAVPRLRAALLA